MTTILLPWPPKELSPNARVHWRKRAARAKAYRADCGWLTLHADPDVPDEGPIPVSVRFCEPDKRRRDTDNLLASIKAGLDGVADALHVNDSRFLLTLERGDPHPGGVVEVRISSGVSVRVERA